MYFEIKLRIKEKPFSRKVKIFKRILNIFTTVFLFRNNLYSRRFSPLNFVNNVLFSVYQETVYV